MATAKTKRKELTATEIKSVSKKIEAAWKSCRLILDKNDLTQRKRDQLSYIMGRLMDTSIQFKKINQ